MPSGCIAWTPSFTDSRQANSSLPQGDPERSKLLRALQRLCFRCMAGRPAQSMGQGLPLRCSEVAHAWGRALHARCSALSTVHCSPRRCSRTSRRRGRDPRSGLPHRTKLVLRCGTILSHAQPMHGERGDVKLTLQSIKLLLLPIKPHYWPNKLPIRPTEFTPGHEMLTPLPFPSEWRRTLPHPLHRSLTPPLMFPLPSHDSEELCFYQDKQCGARLGASVCEDRQVHSDAVHGVARRARVALRRAARALGTCGAQIPGR